MGEIKSNRKVKTNPGVNMKFKNLYDTFLNLKRTRTITPWDCEKIRQRKKVGKCVSERVLWINKRKKPVKCIAVYNRRNSHKAFAYYVSTELLISGARMWMLSRARWAIECVFRTVKQCLSFGRLSCQGENASHLAVSMPLYLYGLLRLEKPEFWGLCKLESPDKMLAKIKHQGMEQSLNIIAGNPKHERLKIWCQRKTLVNTSKKPCTKPAGVRLAA